MTPDTPDDHREAELLSGLADAEWEMHELGSRLDVPGKVRFQLLQAATRAQKLIDAAEVRGSSILLRGPTRLQ
jgi:hypothetical protein